MILLKRFFGTSENTVKTPGLEPVAVYVLVAIGRKLNLEFSLHEMLQILSITDAAKSSVR
jgi:hypothetical protein